MSADSMDEEIEKLLSQKSDDSIESKPPKEKSITKKDGYEEYYEAKEEITYKDEDDKTGKVTNSEDEKW